MKTHRPTTPSRRHMEYVDTSLLAHKEPERSLAYGRKRRVGRNVRGRITVRHKGGGAKRLFREVDFLYDKKNISGRVEFLEYDPNRSGFIALVVYRDGERRYILAPQDLRPGASVLTAADAPLVPGNRTVLARIPIGAVVYNIELKAGSGGILARSAGAGAVVMAQENNYTSLKLPSGEVRLVESKNWASIGSVSNAERSFATIGKAGRARKMGIRPTVRGTAMNPRDHPHGGGEGRTLTGRSAPRTPWGKLARGVKTRNRKKRSSSLIISGRK